MGYFSIMPPADNLLAMVDNPDQWEETLRIIDAMGTSAGHFTGFLVLVLLYYKGIAQPALCMI